MRRANFTVFDEFVPGNTNYTTGSFFTSQELNAKLGQFDQLVIQVVVDNVAGTGGFDLWVEHSSDGRNFTTVNGRTVSDGFGDVTMGLGVNLSTSVANVLWGFPGGPGGGSNVPVTSLFAFVRFRMAFSATTVSGHVKVHVTQRDQG